MKEFKEKEDSRPKQDAGISMGYGSSAYPLTVLLSS
jgi:hypothetical protein